MHRIAIDASRSGLVWLFAVFFGAIMVFGVSVWMLERGHPGTMIGSAFDGIWWAVVTIATVGYGDKIPLSTVGKVAAMAFMVGGVALSAMVSGTIASIFVERRIREGKGLQDIRLKGHTIVCGWNSHAGSILAGLEAESPSTPVILINGMDAERFDAIKAGHPALDLRFVRGDHTQEAVLRKASAQQSRTCILLPDETGESGVSNADERTILAALAMKSLSREVAIRAAILKPESEQHLRRAEVEDIVVHGEFTGFLLSAAGDGGGLPGAARELLSFSSPARLRQRSMPVSLVGMPFAQASDWFIRHGKGVLVGVLAAERPVTLDDILSSSSGAIADFIKRKFAEAQIDIGSDQQPHGKTRLAPSPDYVIAGTDVAFVIGGDDGDD
ncbi:MAG TPA: ion channel [bacterium]|nr:ion channel [bacterium]